MKIGILTSGGDTPGMNAVITGAYMCSKRNNHEVIGILEGWKGLLEKNTVDDAYLGSKMEKNTFLSWGGTVLGSSRTNPYKDKSGKDIQKITQNMKDMGLDCLIAIGGEDTLGVANKLAKDGINVVGVPKTIDNDLCATDYTFGFQTAVQIAADALEKLHTTARAMRRCLVVEVMGRHSGWMTLYAAIAGCAHLALIPEFPLSTATITSVVKRHFAMRHPYCIIAVSEGYPVEKPEEKERIDDFGHKQLSKAQVADALADLIEKQAGVETRSVVLGHTQRSGPPNSYDRVLSYRLGVKAAELAHNKEFGMMSSLQGDQIVKRRMEDAVAKLKVVDQHHWDAAKILFGLD